MQTTNRHAQDFCGCVPEGQPSPHSSPDECARSRGATSDYMRSLNQGVHVQTRDEREIAEARARGEIE